MKGGGEYGSQTGAPYGMFRTVLFSPDYLPCSPPPWGALTAVDMVEGKIRLPACEITESSPRPRCKIRWHIPETSAAQSGAVTPSIRNATCFSSTRWQVPLGSMQNFGVAHTTPVPPGSPSLGGPIVTAGGLVFIAGTLDPVIRAFDVETGKELWEAQLPTNGHAVPITYQLNAKGKQYVVIAAGSHAKIKEEPLGDALVAFTLQ